MKHTEHTHQSHALWPDGTESKDNHWSKEAANVVCKRLEQEGMGGEFPIETWVTPIPFEDVEPEMGADLIEIIQNREAAKKKGKKIKPIYLDDPEPIVHDTPKVGRNDPCPCKSGNKYKKCCGR